MVKYEEKTTGMDDNILFREAEKQGKEVKTLLDEIAEYTEKKEKEFFEELIEDSLIQKNVVPHEGKQYIVLLLNRMKVSYIMLHGPNVILKSC